MDWKSIGEKVAVAVIAGIILGAIGWVASQMIAPDVQTVSAKINWIDVPNPAFRMDRKAASDLDKQIQNIFGVSGAPEFISGLGYEPVARFGTITFQNDTASRSKDIEVDFKDATLFSGDASKQDGSLHSSMTLKALSPNGNATVYFIAPPWLYFQNVPVMAIHNDRKVEILSRHMEPEVEAFIDFSDKYAIIVFALLGTGGVTILILVVSLLLNFAIPNPMKWRAKLVDAKQVKKQIEFIEYIKAHHPEKMPK